MKKSKFKIKYEEIISVENLLGAWQKFVRGKRAKKDVQEFGLRLADNILQLHEELASLTYVHGGYQAFKISDPKPRDIHKAAIRDRVLHHAIYRQLYSFFDRIFIADSYSCQIDKGLHKALNRFRAFVPKASGNHIKTTWVLKCDIKKFFASIDHEILIGILRNYIPDGDVIWLLEKVIRSFEITIQQKGLPLGNLTSQLFCNVYMNEFDQFVKHKLRAKYYIRYADDFVLLAQDIEWLSNLIPKISGFLQNRLGLALHPQKIYLQTLASGIDFLGWVHFSKARVLCAATKKRMIRRVTDSPSEPTMQSYLGLLSHGNSRKVKDLLLNTYFLNAN